MNAHLIRLAVGSSSICLGSWFALAAMAGNVGRQRSISIGAVTLFEQPLAIIVVAATAFAIAYAIAARFRLGAVELLVGVLFGDAVAAVFLAPLAIGELEPVHALLVLSAVAVLGVQPAAALAGAWVANLRSHDLARR